MKIFRFVKKVFFAGLKILSSFTNAFPLSCISMKNQEIDKKDYKDIEIYYTGYVNCNNINSVNSLYLMINEIIGHFEKKNGNKYLVLDDVDENKKVLKKYEEVWEGIKKGIETINSGQKN